jgi:hypothetical protein
MVATPIALPSVYVPVSYRHINWLPAVANIATVTRAEINAGTDLTGAIPVDGVKGFTVAADFAEAPTFAGGLTAKVSKNTLGAADSSLDFLMSLTSLDVRQLLTRGLSGYILMLWEGDIAGRKMTPFQVTVASQSPAPDGGNPARITIQFSLLAFNEMQTIPA